jgi:CheY-like chemotaxis protein
MDRKPKIFIAEDEESLADICKMRFENAGFIVEICHNGLSLVEKVAQDTPDVILLDINMPEMNGYEVLETIHKNFEDKNKVNVPVIVWSNITDQGSIDRMMKSGATAYLRKVEYSEGNLVERVKAIMEENKIYG